jgi:putative flippase GtrA
MAGLRTSPRRSYAYNSETIWQFMRFAVVGVIQNGLNLGVFAVFVIAGVPFLLASALAAILALAVSFMLNHRWTFPGGSDRVASRVVRYITIWVIIVLCALSALAILVDIAHIEKVLAQAIVVVAGAPVSYAAQRRWTFKGE